MKRVQGFTLIELVTVIILVGVVSITLFSRLGSVNAAAVQAGRDDVIAALFFAQQSAMMRANIQLLITPNSVSVTENGTPLQMPTAYPLSMPTGVSLAATPATYSYDKLGRTSAGTITVTGSGNTQGTSATIVVEASGYAY